MDEFASPACSLSETTEIEFTIRDALLAASRRIPGDTPRLEAEALLGSLLNQPRAWLLAHPETPLSSETAAEFDSAVARLAGGEPLAYLTGHREFFGLEFLVNRHVLVPRPETELLVEHALKASQQRGKDSSISIADIGTGSGIIAVTLAVHLPQARLIATDKSPDALRVAQTNAERHNVLDRIAFRQGDLLEPLAEPVDIICANLPYIDTTELAALPISHHEPRLALDGGHGGLSQINRLLQAAPTCLNPNGLILLEIGATQSTAATAAAQTAFPQATIQTHRDLANLPRLLSIQTTRP